jgi:hypothetical protein
MEGMEGVDGPARSTAAVDGRLRHDERLRVSTEGLLVLIVFILMIETAYLVLGREKLAIDEFMAFMKVRKRWWLGPILMMFALLGLMLAFTQGSAMAPFIYSLF